MFVHASAEIKFGAKEVLSSWWGGGAGALSALYAHLALVDCAKERAQAAAPCRAMS